MIVELIHLELNGELSLIMLECMFINSTLEDFDSDKNIVVLRTSRNKFVPSVYPAGDFVS